MNARTLMAGLAVSTLLLGSASAAMAYGHRGGHMDGYRGGCNGGPCYYANGNYQGMSQEQRDAMTKLMQERASALDPIVQQLDAKRLELDALSRNPNAKPETISKLAQEIADLQGQIRKTNNDFRAKVQKDTGLQMGPRGGMMMDGRGYNGHMRGGHHMMGWDD